MSTTFFKKLNNYAIDEKVIYQAIAWPLCKPLSGSQQQDIS
ncbi:hypothetical protein [Lactiplantibacillus carotarum]|nr:hypothetical protein [Lactiplantibacillus carotarum]